ncbi:MAG: RNA polymerase subunit sigma [Cytophagales bacterium]|nr:RNA polymerase subunit sigma [Cytophagales bacterium]
MADIESSKIIQLIREGKDKLAISMLYKKVLPQVKNYISKNKGKKEDANDVFHDALIVLYEQVVKGTFNEKYNIFGYLYRLSLFRWLNMLKKEKPMAYMEELPEMTMEENYGRWDGNDVTQDRNVLQSLFSQIGEKCVELLTYAIYSEMLAEDIMLRMGFNSVDATRMQQVRCKQKLIKEIENNPALLEKLKGL